jgi:hypothetical protein
MLAGWINALGAPAQYAATRIEIAPADELRGRAAVYETQWEDIHILIDLHGPVERLNGSVREEIEQLAFYATVEMQPGMTLRYHNRDYVVSLSWYCPQYGEDCWRHESTAAVKR